MTRFLLLRGRQYRNEALRAAALQLKTLAARLCAIDNLEALRGMEGAAARTYFEAVPHLILTPGFEFNGRNRRPPLNPANALLSFVYTLLTNEMLSALKICGLEPYLGALHEVSYGRPSLACDFVEEYCVFLGDRFVLGLINKKLVTLSDFVIRKNAPATYVDEKETRERRPVEMKPVVGRTFIRAYEEMMRGDIDYPLLGKRVSYRFLIQQQARRFCEYLEKQSIAYHPFTWEG